MLTATPQRAKRKAAPRQKKTAKPPVRFPGIIADAKALGVHRITLYRVLTGEFAHLKGLRRRYDALKQAGGAR